MAFAAALPSLRVPVARIRWFAWTGLAVAAYWAVLSFVYIHSISPVNATDSFLYLRIDGEKIAEGAVWAALLLPTAESTWSRPSDFGIAILYLIGLVPCLILFGLSDQPRAVIYTIIAGYLAALAGVSFPLRIARIRLRRGAASAIFIACGITAITLAWYLAKGTDTFNINLLAVYDYRQQANAVFDYGPISYLATWTPRVLVPYCMCYFLFRKKWALFAATFVLQMFCLAIFQEKMVFLPCVMLMLLYFLPPGRPALIWLIAAFIATIVGCELIYDLSGNFIPIQLWPRRFFFDEQFLYFNYFDVFSKLGFVYYSDSFLGWLIHYPFADTPAAMVEYYAMGKTAGNPNTGFFGAGYMELGTAGVILYGFAAGFVLKLFDRTAPDGIPLWFFGTFAFLPLFAMLISENFVTALLTGGVGLSLVLMLCSTALPFDPRADAAPPAAG